MLIGTAYFNIGCQIYLQMCTIKLCAYKALCIPHMSDMVTNWYNIQKYLRNTHTYVGYIIYIYFICPE